MGITKDIWDITKEIGQSALKHANDNKVRKDNLRLFSQEFTQHPPDETDLVDYNKFIEEESVFRARSGRILSATHKEVIRLWAKPEIIGPYEAFLRSHLDSGGELARVFVAGPELLTPGALKTFALVLYRHHCLGFAPRVISVSDLATLIRSLQVDCDMFGVVCDAIAYFIRFPNGSTPLVARSRHGGTVATTAHAHKYLYAPAENWESWLSRMPVKLSTRDKKRVEDECRIVFGLASCRKDELANATV